MQGNFESREDPDEPDANVKCARKQPCPTVSSALPGLMSSRVHLVPMVCILSLYANIPLINTCLIARHVRFVQTTQEPDSSTWTEMAKERARRKAVSMYPNPYNKSLETNLIFSRLLF
jgi:hypothetical protein